MIPPATPTRWFRVNLWLHRWTGLIATVPFLILCLTGTILIFHEEIDAALGVVPAAEQADAPARPWDESVTRVQAACPEERVLSVGVDPEHHPGVLLVATAPSSERGFDRARFHVTDLARADLLGEVDFDQTVTGFLLELHAQWFLGPIGELVGALIALLVLLSRHAARSGCLGLGVSGAGRAAPCGGGMALVRAPQDDGSTGRRPCRAVRHARVASCDARIVVGQSPWRST